MKDKYDVAMKRTAQWLDIRDENVLCLHVIGSKSHPYNYSVTPAYALFHLESPMPTDCYQFRLSGTLAVLRWRGKSA